MAKAGRYAEAALVAGVILAVAAPARAKEETNAVIDQTGSTIVVHVANHAEVAPDLLAAAMERVESVYKQIGVRIEWDDRGVGVPGIRGGTLHLNVLLLSRDSRGKRIADKGTNNKILGYAQPATRRAYVFPARIAALPGPPAYPGVQLGDVVAHELGHLVLRTPTHSTRGIMRANLEWQSMMPHVFNDRDGRTIRAALMASR